MTGARLRTSEVMAAYAAWATVHSEQSINYLELQREMAKFGHRRLRSNGMRFADVAFASKAIPPGEALALLDRCLVELRVARSLIEAA
ncbi:MAG: hypothetical protein KF780_12365 [Sphingomonas sp.]|nr:hypothetical protein [Sphingomonas sp.]